MTKSDVADESANAEEPTAAPEVTQAEQDALMSAQDGVDGALTPNSPKEEEDVSSPEPADDSSGDNLEQPEGESADGTPAGTETPEAEPTEPAPELTEEKDEAGVYAPQTVEDPGDFKPNDYSFEIKTTDGKAHTINTVEDAEVLAAELDEHPELITASQFMALNRKTAVMERGLTEDQKKYEADKAQFEAQKALTDTRDNQLLQWSKEINYLAESGDLPKISDELNNSDWSDPVVAKDPAVKARLEVFKWMEGENNKRLAAGLEPVRSVLDAHAAMQLEAMKQNSQATVSREKDTRRAKGSMVGGSAAHMPSNVPANTIIGAGGSLDDLVSDYMNQ